MATRLGLYLRRAMIIGALAAIPAVGFAVYSHRDAGPDADWFAGKRAEIEAVRRELAALRAHAMTGHNAAGRAKHVREAGAIQSRCVALLIEHNDAAAAARPIGVDPIDDEVCI